MIEVKCQETGLSPNFRKILPNLPVSRVQVVGELPQTKSFLTGERNVSAIDYLADFTLP